MMVILQKVCMALTALGLTSGLVVAQPAASDYPQTKSGTSGISSPGSEPTNEPGTTPPPAAPSSEPTTGPVPTPSPAAPSLETPPGSGTTTEVIMTPASSQVLATELIGQDAVYQEQEVGEVDDLLLDKDGKTAGVVLSVGGIFGIGGKQVTLPWDRVTVSKAGDKSMIRTAMSKDELEAAPYFEPAKPDAEPEQWAPPGTPGAAVESATSSASRDPDSVIMSQANSQVLATKLIGQDAVYQDKQVGAVDDLLFEKDGRIAGVVLSVGNALGGGKKQVALPWNQVTVNRKAGNQSTIGTAMPKEELEAAPDFQPAKPGAETH